MPIEDSHPHTNHYSVGPCIIRRGLYAELVNARAVTGAFRGLSRFSPVFGGVTTPNKGLFNDAGPINSEDFDRMPCFRVNTLHHC